MVDFEPPGDEAQKAKYWQDVGFTYAREHVRQLPKVVAARVGRQWELFRPWQTPEFAPIEGRSVNWTWAGLFSYYLLAGLSIAGGIRLWRRKVPLLPLLAQVVAVTITAAYAYGTVALPRPRRTGALRARRRRCGAARSPVPAPGCAPGARRNRSRDESAWLAGGRGGWSQRASWWAVGIVAAFIALPLRGLYHTPGAPMEEGFMLTFPERVMKGDIPNVDFLHLYGPGSLDVLAAVYSIFGVRLTVERTFGLLQHVAIIAAIYVLARAWGRLAAASSAVICAVLVLTPIGLDALAWNGGVALGLWSVVLALRAEAPDTRRPLRWRIAAGVLAGLALTLPARPGDRPHPRARDAAVATAPGRALPLRDRVRRRPPAADRPPAARRAGELVPRHDPRPRLQPPPRSHAAPPAVVEPPRRRAAGDRREGAAVVADPSPRRPAPTVPVVLPAPGRLHRRRRRGVVAPPRRAGRTAPPRAPRRRPVRGRPAAAGVAAAGLRPPRRG